jgi:Trypsin
VRLLSAPVVAPCALLASVLASVGCGAPEPTGLGSRTAAIVNGDVSPDEQNAIVAIEFPSGLSFTGTIVAPTLVLTARHAVVEYADRTSSTVLNCTESLRGAPVDHNVAPEDLSVHVGSKAPLEPAAGVVRIFSGGSLDLCESDVALLELDTSLDVPPLPLRLQSETEQGESGTLIGWGLTERDVGTRGFVSPHGSRRQVQLTVEAVGPDKVKLEGGVNLNVPDSWFVTGPGACYGDSGAPFVSQRTGAVIGVVSTQELLSTGAEAGSLEGCLVGKSAYRRLAAPQYAWLKEAFRAAGQAPWYEGLAPPAATGSSCQSDEECLFQVCLHAKSGSFCSQKCATAECPSDMTCLVVSDESATAAQPLCVLDQLDVPTPDKSGCTVGSSAPHCEGISSLYLLALTLWKRSRKTNRSGFLARATRRTL